MRQRPLQEACTLGTSICFARCAPSVPPCWAWQFTYACLFEKEIKLENKILFEYGVREIVASITKESCKASEEEDKFGYSSHSHYNS